MRIAVVGLGTAGADLHLAALAGLDGVEVVGVCDRDAARTRAVADRFRVPACDDFQGMLDGVQPEVVIVATPPETHVEYCLSSLAAGAHVLCEKPFVPSVAEADRVLEAAARARRQVALNHEFREMPIFRALRDRIGAPGVGDLVSLQLWQLMDLPPWAERGWRSGMPAWSFFEGGIHLVDYALAVFGEKPRAVWATMSTCGVDERTSDAVTTATLEFSRGRLAHIVQNRLCRGETQYFEARIDCREASLRGSFGGRVRLSAGLHRSTRPHVRLELGASGIAWIERGHARRIVERNPKNPPMIATRLLLTRTLDAFRSGGAPPASGTAARDGIEVLAACYRSAETGRRVVPDGVDGAELAAMSLGAA